MKENILEIRHLSKTFGDHEVLKDIDFTVHSGDVTSIIGASGSGKSTLLRCVNLLETPTSGQVLFHGQDVTAAGNNPNAYRAKVGMVFQSFNLISRTSALKNVELPMTYARVPKAKRAVRAQLLLERVGLGARKEHMPNELSGGQRQRVAIARALANEPPLILADEPTGALDSKNSKNIMEMLRGIREYYGTTIIMVTHDPNAASFCSRILFIQDGVLFHELRRQIPKESQNDFYLRILEVMAQLGGGSANVL
mgnify:CR=1 FL=1